MINIYYSQAAFQICASLVILRMSVRGRMTDAIGCGIWSCRKRSLNYASALRRPSIATVFRGARVAALRWMTLGSPPSPRSSLSTAPMTLMQSKTLAKTRTHWRTKFLFCAGQTIDAASAVVVDEPAVDDSRVRVSPLLSASCAV